MFSCLFTCFQTLTSTTSPPIAFEVSHYTKADRPKNMQANLLPSGVTKAPDSAAVKRLERRLDSLQNSPFLQNGFLGVSVQSVNAGQKVISYNGRKSLQPASTMKLITTATAFAVLSDSFRYETTLRYDGRLVENVLVGNLYVVGSGDPSLGSWRFKNFPDAEALMTRWAKKIKDLGIRQVQGKIIVDGSIFEANATPDTWVWGDMGNYYGTPAFGLNFNENSFKVIFKPNKVGEDAKVIRLEPELPNVEIINHVQTDAPGTGDQVVIFSKPLDSQAILEGFVPAGMSEFTVKGAVPDPALLLGNALKKKLAELNIRIADEVTTIFSLQKQGKSAVVPNTNVLDYYYSPTLFYLAQQTNYQSINLYAEALMKTISTKLSLGNTTSAGVKAIKQVWQGKGIDLRGFNIKDGSGLSTITSLTAENMTGILVTAAKEPNFQSFLSSIPVMGESGTVRNLGRSTKAAGNVHAKSGSIEGVRAYAGYFTTKTGELMTFSMMINRYDADLGNATKELEKLMVMLVAL